MSDPLIRVRDLEKVYHDGTRELRILRGVHLVVHCSEAVAIVGQSGSGKSTLLNLLGGLDHPTKGEILLGKENLAAMNSSRLNQLRRERMGFVFQQHHLMPELRAWENVAMPLRIRRLSVADARTRAVEMLQRVGLEDRIEHIPAKLSGGEQQRVAIARALVSEPEVIFADEPTGNLDVDMAKQVIDLLWSLTRDQGRSLVIVTHERTIAEKADRVLRLKEGVLTVEA